MTRFAIFATYIAGAGYADYAGRLGDLQFKQELRLVREPDNQYDSRAIRIDDAAGVKIGYVPRDRNMAFGRMLDHGYDLRAQVDKVEAAQNLVWVSLTLPNLVE